VQRTLVVVVGLPVLAMVLVAVAVALADCCMVSRIFPLLPIQ
jgi:hypothetical protein